MSVHPLLKDEGTINRRASAPGVKQSHDMELPRVIGQNGGHQFKGVRGGRQATDKLGVLLEVAKDPVGIVRRENTQIGNKRRVNFINTGIMHKRTEVVVSM